MNTTDTYTKDGLLNPMSFKGRVESVDYYVCCENLPVIDHSEMDEELCIAEIISMVNNYRMDLRQKAVVVYGD